MAKINISKRLRKSAYAASEDEVSLSDATSRDYDDSDVDPEYHQIPAKRARRSNLRATSVMSSGSDRSDSSAMPAARKPTRIPDPKCTNRNALLARENRKRKKEEKEVMEKQIKKLTQANKIFADKCKRLRATEAKMAEMAEEIRFLKSVIEKTPQFSQSLQQSNNTQTDTSSTSPAASSGYATSDTASVSSDHDENLDHIELLETDTVIMNSTFFDDVTFSDNIKIVDEFQPTIARTPPSSARSQDHDYVLASNYQRTYWTANLGCRVYVNILSAN